MNKLKYYIFCIRWLWKNREWENTRQKFRAMERAYKKMERAYKKGGDGDGKVC